MPILCNGIELLHYFLIADQAEPLNASVNFREEGKNLLTDHKGINRMSKIR